MAYRRALPEDSEGFQPLNTAICDPSLSNTTWRMGGLGSVTFREDGSVTYRGVGGAQDGQWATIDTSTIEIKVQNEIVEYHWEIRDEGRYLRLEPRWPLKKAAMEYERD